jgi:hypothetical protein
MAGAGYKLFNTGDVLTAAQVNTYLNEQTVMVFASSAARTSALSGVLAEGMVSYLQDTNAVEVYNGSAWVGVSGAGDVTEVQAGTGISVASGTGPIPVVTNTMATEITASGDIIVGTGSGTFDNLPIGTTGQVLTSDTTVSPYKVKWAAPAGGGGVTLLSTTSLSGVTTTITDISQSYTHLLVIAKNCYTSGADSIRMRLDGDSGSNYYHSGLLVTTTTLSAYNSNAETQFPIIYAPENVTGRLGQAEIWLYNYTSTSNHSYLVRGFSGNGSTNKSSISLQGYQVSSSAIDSVSFNGGSDTCTGTIFIYGVK